MPKGARYADSEGGEGRRGLSATLRHALSAGALWTFLVAVSLVWNGENLSRQTLTLATDRARAIWDKDQAFRRWATLHGGLYVKPDARTPPNPYLAHVPNRDVETTDGASLTLMNPAYMMRQMTEEFELLYGIKGKITGLIQLNPINAPDPWERRALESFEVQPTEIIDESEIDGEPYLRLMRPMPMVEGCVKCHGHLGYELGDIRGGVSVSVPLASYRAAAADSRMAMGITHLAVWLIGVAGIAVIARQSLARERERRRAEAETRRLVDHLTHSNAELERFAFIVSHDLQEPVRSMVSYTQLLRRQLEGALGEKSQAYMDFITEGALRMRNQVADLLTYCRVGDVEGGFEPIDPRGALDAAVAALDVSIRDTGTRLVIGPLPPVVADEAQISIVFQHLIGNAIKYAKADESPAIEVSGRVEGDQAVLSVRDNGIGIENVYLERIFEVFKRLHTHHTYPGTGIGLAVCKRVVERHHGRIWAESVPGEGSAFSFALPRNVRV